MKRKSSFDVREKKGERNKKRERKQKREGEREKKKRGIEKGDGYDSRVRMRDVGGAWKRMLTNT